MASRYGLQGATQEKKNVVILETPAAVPPTSEAGFSLLADSANPEDDSESATATYHGSAMSEDALGALGDNSGRMSGHSLKGHNSTVVKASLPPAPGTVSEETETRKSNDMDPLTAENDDGAAAAAAGASTEDESTEKKGEELLSANSGQEPGAGDIKNPLLAIGANHQTSDWGTKGGTPPSTFVHMPREQNPEVQKTKESLLRGLALVDTDSEGRATLSSVEPILRTLGFKEGDLDVVLPERVAARHNVNKHPTIMKDELVERVLVLTFGDDYTMSLSSSEASGAAPVPTGRTRRKTLVQLIENVGQLEHQVKNKDEQVQISRNVLDVRLAAVMGNKRRVWADGMARRLWDSCHLVAIMLLSIATSYFTYFEQTTDPLWLVITSWCLHVFFWLDIIISTQLAGFDFSANQIVLQVKSIIKLRRTSLAIDVVTAIPVDLIIQHAVWGSPVEGVPFGSMSQRTVVAFQVFRWVQWIKIFRSFFLFEFTNVDFITPGHVDFFITNRPLMIGSALATLAMHALTICYALTHPKRGDVYWRALVDTLAMITGSGPGVDIEPTWQAQFLGIFLIVLAVLVQGLVIGQMSVIVFRSDVKSANVQRMRETLAILEHYRVPQDTMREVLSYQMHALNDDADKTQSVLQQLPEAMRREIVVYVKVDAIQRVSLFAPASADCKIYLAKQLQRCIAPPLDDIVSIGDIGDEMFMISHGDADVIIVTGLTVATLSRGDYFGEIALVTEQCTRQATVRALSYCDLWALSREPFMEAVMKFPMLCEIVVQHMATKKIEPDYFLAQVAEARLMAEIEAEEEALAAEEEAELAAQQQEEEDAVSQGTTHASSEEIVIPVGSINRTVFGTGAETGVGPLEGSRSHILNKLNSSSVLTAGSIGGGIGDQSDTTTHDGGEANKKVDRRDSFRRTPVTGGTAPKHRRTGSGSTSERSASPSRLSPKPQEELKQLNNIRSSMRHRRGSARGGSHEEPSLGAFSSMIMGRPASVVQHRPQTSSTPFLAREAGGSSSTPLIDDLNQMAADELEEENRMLKAEVASLEGRITQLVGYVDYFEREIFALSSVIAEKAKIDASSLTQSQVNLKNSSLQKELSIRSSSRGAAARSQSGSLQNRNSIEPTPATNTTIPQVTSSNVSTPRNASYRGTSITSSVQSGPLMVQVASASTLQQQQGSSAMAGAAKN